MRNASLAFVFAFAACGGSHNGVDQCTAVPAPPACMIACDPSPGAPNTCPQGYHCSEDGHCDAVCTPGGGQCGDGYTCTDDGRCIGGNNCTGLECQINTGCMASGKPDTTLSGTVFAPNGTLPLYGITVYIPN